MQENVNVFLFMYKKHIFKRVLKVVLVRSQFSRRRLYRIFNEHS